MKDRAIALVGDFNSSVTAHQAIPEALRIACNRVDQAVNWHWVGTDTISSSSDLEAFDAIWCVPASPYENMDGALTAIQYARASSRPFLGTCGGFQHALVEYARNGMHLIDADHAESNPDASLQVVTPLTCSLKGKSGSVYFAAGSRLSQIYRAPSATEAYHCSYGMNPEFETMLLESEMKVSARDEDGSVRAIELTSHPFFIATLFQPERSALMGAEHPLIAAFVVAAVEQQSS